MIYKDLFAVLSVFMMLASRSVYFATIFKGNTRPHAFSWFIWGVISTIGFAAQVSDGAGPGSWARGVGAVTCFILVGIALFWRGEKNITRTDWMTFIAALMAIPLWIITQTPVWSVVLLCVIDTLGYYPTIRKSWLKPEQEPAFGYFISAFSAIFSIIAISHYSVSTWLYSAVLATTNLSMMLLLVTRRRSLVRLATVPALCAALLVGVFTFATTSYAYNGDNTYETQTSGNGRNNNVRIASALLPDEAAAPFDVSQMKASKIVVYKSERRMDLLDANGNPFRSYMVALGKMPVGDKQQEGDMRTPEGRYFIEGRNPKSDYYLSLKISYPNPADRQRAQKKGVSPGGSIFIHGMPNGKSWMMWKYNKNRDWTNGCIAVYNSEIKEIWELVDDGTPIIIRP